MLRFCTETRNRHSNHTQKQVQLVRNEYKRTVDYEADLLTFEEAVLIANSSDWLTAAWLKTAICEIWYPKPCSVEKHIKACLNATRFKSSDYIKIQKENVLQRLLLNQKGNQGDKGSARGALKVSISTCIQHCS